MYTLQRTLRKSGWVWVLLAAGLMQGMMILLVMPNQSPSTASQLPSPGRVNR